jgi:hypothetical protein
MNRFLRALCLVALCGAACAVQAQTNAAASTAATELRFGELFARPVGPRGLTPSAKLLALDGQTVRMVGYMAAAELPTPGLLVLTPLPSSLGDEDESLADDLPPQVVFVHLSGAAAAQTLANRAGLLRLQGRLSVGPQEEADGHVSTVRLLLDAEASAQLLSAPPATPAKNSL